MKTDYAKLLAEKIQEMEKNLAEQRDSIKLQFKVTVESLKPVNLIKSAMGSEEIQKALVDPAIGLASGYAAKKAFVRSSKSRLLNIVGSILQIGITNIVTKNPDRIKSIGTNILKSLFKKRQTPEPDEIE